MPQETSLCELHHWLPLLQTIRKEEKEGGPILIPGCGTKESYSCKVVPMYTAFFMFGNYCPLLTPLGSGIIWGTPVLLCLHVISLLPAHIFVYSPLLNSPPIFLIWLCHQFPAGTLTGIISLVQKIMSQQTWMSQWNESWRYVGDVPRSCSSRKTGS